MVEIWREEDFDLAWREGATLGDLRMAFTWKSAKDWELPPEYLDDDVVESLSDRKDYSDWFCYYISATRRWMKLQGLPLPPIEYSLSKYRAHENAVRIDPAVTKIIRSLRVYYEMER